MALRLEVVLREAALRRAAVGLVLRAVVLRLREDEDFVALGLLREVERVDLLAEARGLRVVVRPLLAVVRLLLAALLRPAADLVLVRLAAADLVPEAFVRRAAVGLAVRRADDLVDFVRVAVVRRELLRDDVVRLRAGLR